MLKRAATDYFISIDIPSFTVNGRLAVGIPSSPIETVELELSHDLIHWETQDLQLPIDLLLNFPLAQDMQFMRVKRINE